MSSQKLDILIHEVADGGIPATYDGWPAIRTRLGGRPRSSRRPGRAWRLAGAALIAAIVLVVGTTLLITSTPQAVNAEVLVDRAGAASEGLGTTVRSYHITATMTLKPADSSPPVVQQEETWFDAPGRMRQETHTPGWSTITVSDGTQAWWTVTRDGRTYVAPANGIRFSDVAYLNPLAPEGTNIASVLAFLGRQGCGTFRLQADETVAGRQAYVVSATHTLESMLNHTNGCGNPIQLLIAPSPSPAADNNPVAAATSAAGAAAKRLALATPEPARQGGGGKVGPVPSPGAATSQAGKPDDASRSSELQRLLSTTVVDTFWIDKQTFVPLKADQSLGPKGTSQYEVTSAEFDVTVPDSTFHFTPPSGAQMMPDPAALKQVLAGR